jgi:hypothetical protein
MVLAAHASCCLMRSSFSGAIAFTMSGIFGMSAFGTLTLN